MDFHLENKISINSVIICSLAYLLIEAKHILLLVVFSIISIFSIFSIFNDLLCFRIKGPLRNGPVKRTPGRLPRIPFTPYQLNELEAAYKHANYLSSEDANKLAIRLDLTCVRVKIWFQNRRARERREKRDLKTKMPTYSAETIP